MKLLKLLKLLKPLYSMKLLKLYIISTLLLLLMPFAASAQQAKVVSITSDVAVNNLTSFVDGTSNYASFMGIPQWVEIELDTPITIPEYYLYVSENSVFWKSWKLKAKENEGDEWVTISTVTNSNIQNADIMSEAYKVDAAYANKLYRYLRFDDFQVNVSSGTLYIDEFCVFDPETGFCKFSNIGKLPQKKNGVYQIETISNLYAYSQYPHSDVILLNDIVDNPDINNPIREWSAGYIQGHTFDGNGHSISGLYSEYMFAGLFKGIRNSTIKNLTIKDSYFCNPATNSAAVAGAFSSYAYNSTFIGCHNASTVVSYNGRMGGITGQASSAAGYESTYISCLNTGKVCDGNGNVGGYGICAEDIGHVIDCVSLEGSATQMCAGSSSIIGDNNHYVTEEELSNGVACWYLNNGVTDGSQSWYQRIGIDELPIPTVKRGGTVYGGYAHGASQLAISNTNTLHAIPYNSAAQAEDSGNHGMSIINGRCSVCGLKSCAEHIHYTNGICDVCKYICPHGRTVYNNGFGNCLLCSLEMEKIYQTVPLGADGYYEVENMGQLYWMAGQIASDKYLKFRLVNNIVDNENVLNPDGTLRDAGSIHHHWSAINKFFGTFDGCGHTVSGLYGEPLFTELHNASVRNLGIQDSYTKADGFVGSIASEAVNTNISYCYSKATVEADNDYPDFFIGGLVGHADGMNLSNSYYKGTTRGGGICGYATSSDFSHIYTSKSNISYEGADGTDQHAGVSVEDFASGSIAFSLNDEIADGTQRWYQKLGTDDAPVLLAKANNTVYHIQNCLGNWVYENELGHDGHAFVDKGTNFKCKYCDAIRTAALDTNDYLSFTARGTNALIGIVKHGDAPDLTLMYSSDKQTWTKKIISSTEDILSIPVDRTYYFRRSPDDASNTLNTDAENYWSFTSTGNATVEADGSILSLISPIPDDAVMGDYAFYGLFRDWAKLSKAPELPATGALPKYAYTDIFRNCPLIKDLTISFNDYVATGCLDGWLTGTADGTTGNLHIKDELRGEYIPLPANWQVVCEDVHDFVVEKDKLGNAVWAWTETPLSAKIKLVCTKNPNHTDAYAALPGELTSLVTTQPTCTLDGVRTYTATITYGGVEYQNSHDAAEPALGHDYQYGVCSRCGDNLDHYDTFTITDGNPYLISKECTVDELTYSRGYTPSVWSAWFTPFAVSVAELEAVGLTAAYIEGIHQYDDNNDGMIDRTSIEAIKITNGRLRAGTPYIVKASEGYNPHLRLSMVTMASANDLVPIETSTATLTFNFQGTYSGMTAEEVNAVGNLYSLSPTTGSLVRRTGKIQPLRWYCSITNKGSMYDDEPVAASVLGAIYIHVKGEEDTSTGIRTIYPENSQTMERVDSGIFDLGGTKLPAPQRGKINVVKGKKFVK